MRSRHPRLPSRELRRLDWIPRSVRAEALVIERASEWLEARLQRAPNDEELATALCVTIEQFRDTLLNISNATIAALDEL